MTAILNFICFVLIELFAKAYDQNNHGQFEQYSILPNCLISRTPFLSFWCVACSISAIGECYNDRSQISKYFQNSYTLEIGSVEQGGI